MGDDMRKPRACECYGRIPLGHDMFLLRPEISTFAEKYRQRHAAIDFPDYQSRTQQWEVFGLHAQNRKTRKSGSVQTIIQGQKPEPMMQCVSSDEEVGKNSARAGVQLFSSSSNVLLEGTARSAPGGFIEIPVHRDACFFAEGIKEGFRPTGRGE